MFENDFPLHFPLPEDEDELFGESQSGTSFRRPYVPSRREIEHCLDDLNFDNL